MDSRARPQSEPARMVAEFQKRRETIVSGLKKIDGITCKSPLGAFYVIPNMVGTEMNSRQLSDLLLNKTGVAVLPGTSFG